MLAFVVELVLMVGIAFVIFCSRPQSRPHIDILVLSLVGVAICQYRRITKSFWGKAALAAVDVRTVFCAGSAVAYDYVDIIGHIELVKLLPHEVVYSTFARAAG